jgi:hypothetical protein
MIVGVFADPLQFVDVVTGDRCLDPEDEARMFLPKDLQPLDGCV